MKAAVFTRYGPPKTIQIEQVEKPTPRDDEVLVKVMAASVNAYDWHMLTGKPFLVRLTGSGFLKPKGTILGADVSGRVEAVGKSTTQFHPGDEVYGTVDGGFAEYVCAPERYLSPKPANLSFEEAAAVPMAGCTALQSLRDRAKLRPGQRVLINGASGGVGTFAVQVAKALGGEVTAVCSTGNLETARSLGADHVIDYTKEDFSRSGQLYDVVYAANGNRSPSAYGRALTPGGIYVISGGTTSQLFQTILLGRLASRRGKKAGVMMAKRNQGDLAFLKGLIESGKVRPVIDRRYTLDRTAEAVGYVCEGHARGKVVITVATPAE